MKGSRYNDGKLKWSLVDYKALEPMVRVLDYGARKYTSIDVPLLEQDLKVWNAHVVKGKETLELKGSVIHVMRQNCLMQIRIVSKEKQTTTKPIVKRIANGLKKWTEHVISSDKLIQCLEKSDVTLGIEESMVSVVPISKDLSKKAVSYANERRARCTLTTTIQLEGLEVCCAVSATTDSASLTMMLTFLNGVLNTSLQTETYVETGAHNWKKGLLITEVCESMLRHIHAFLDCENNDPESGLPHIGHIQCNAMFLGAMVKRPDMDDRVDPKQFELKLDERRD